MKINYSYLRKNKGRKYQEQAEKTIYKNKLKVETYYDATILPLKKFHGDTLQFGRGGVVDNKGEYVSSSGLATDSVYGDYDFEKPIISNERVVYLGYFNPHWGHFLTDSTTRLWYYLNEDSSIDKYVFFTKEGKKPEIRGNIKKVLQLFGILDKIEIINTPTCYKSVIVPEMGYCRGGWYSDEYKRVFEKIKDNVISTKQYRENEKKYEKVFFSRSQLKPVLELGLEMLDDFFLQNGFYIIYPEKEELENMIYLLDNAKVVATMCGTCQHNILFGNDKTELIIIERRVFWDQNLLDICKIKDANVTFIDANLPIYTVGFRGPHIIYFTEQMNCFCLDKKLLKPCEKYCSKSFLKKLLKKYLSEYKKMYHRCWCMYTWYERDMGLLTEAYNDSFNYIGAYLSGEKALYFIDLFSLRYWKIIIKNILKR